MIPAISSLLPSLLGITGSSSSAGAAQTSLSLPQDSAPSISPAGRLLSLLQQLQQQNPNKFKQVLSHISDRLRKAANAAMSAGSQLNKLADQFQNAAQGGPLPTAQDLQQAGLATHRQPAGRTDLLSLFQPQQPDANASGLLASLLGMSANGTA